MKDQKRHRLFGIAFSMLAALPIAAFPASFGGAQSATRTDMSLPLRKPGLWRISTVAPEIGMQTNDVCIDGDDKIIGDPAEGCEPPTVQRAEDQIIVSYACKRRDGRETTSLLFTGDFENWYRAQAKITSSGHGGERRVGFTIEGKFIRPDCR